MDEYIEKQAAIDAIEEWYELYPDSDAAREALSQVKRRIKKLTPADVKPAVRGRWEVTPLYIKCSECSDSFPLIPQNFCPNCGADMREGEDGDEGD